jgi:hypothetical protein
MAGFQKIQSQRTTRRRRPTRRASPRRGRGRGARGCGRPGHTRTSTNRRKTRLEGRISRTQGSARRRLTARRRVEGFPSVRRTGVRQDANTKSARLRSLWKPRSGVSTKQHRATSRPHSFLARQRRRSRARVAQELHPSRCCSSAARRPASRQVLTGEASQRRGTIARRRPRGRREQSGRAVLTVGRRCSRGRLGEGVYTGGVGVHAGGHPPQLRLLAPGSSSPAGSHPPSSSAARCRPLPLFSQCK